MKTGDIKKVRPVLDFAAIFFLKETIRWEDQNQDGLTCMGIAKKRNWKNVVKLLQ